MAEEQPASAALLAARAVVKAFPPGDHHRHGVAGVGVDTPHETMVIVYLDHAIPATRRDEITQLVHPVPAEFRVTGRPKPAADPARPFAHLDRQMRQGYQVAIVDYRGTTATPARPAPEPQPATPYYTYRQLRAALAGLSEAELDQQVQVLPPNSGGLEAVLAVGTVRDMTEVDGVVVTETKSDLDWRHHPEQVVLVRDSHSWGEFGDPAYELRKCAGETVFVGARSGVVESIDDTRARKTHAAGPRFVYDAAVRAGYVYLRPGTAIAATKEVYPGIVLDVGPADELVGVEILDCLRPEPGPRKEQK